MVGLTLASTAFGTVPARAHVDWVQQSGIVQLDSATVVADGARPLSWRSAGRLDVPDRFGPGAVLSAGNVRMKVVNNGTLGNPFTISSSDPAGQWPGMSGVEYLNAIAFAVGAVNPMAPTADAVRRVSFFEEWRPPTLDPVDHIYSAFDGIANGQRFVNDDHDTVVNAWGEHVPRIDEDFLDGQDNDGDGLVDEDYGALGQQMFSYVMRDDTPQAINTVFNERHVPLGLQANVRAWAYSIPGMQNFNVCEYAITNVSGHMLDSLTIGWLVDMDAGPISLGSFWLDDIDVPEYPSGDFVYRIGGDPGDLPDPPRKQGGEGTQDHAPPPDLAAKFFPVDSALCPRLTLRVNAFSVTDKDGDQEQTPGIGTFMLIDHTTDRVGGLAPRRVGFRSFRSCAGFRSFTQGGLPRTDQERFQLMESRENIDPSTGLIDAPPGTTQGDYVEWCSVGPWLRVAPGRTITATIAFGVSPGTAALAGGYVEDYARYRKGQISGAALAQKYPSLQMALAAQVAFEGIHEYREDYQECKPIARGGRDFHGRETPIRLPPGSPPTVITETCPEPKLTRDVTVTDQEYSWFDFDCDFCTGVWVFRMLGQKSFTGLFHKTWNASAPPPNPHTNVSAEYDFSDNPDRTVVPSGDKVVRLAWDNLPDLAVDPQTSWLDFRGFQIWKAADWSRPPGTSGPQENDWLLVGEFRAFDYFKGNNPGDPPLERNYTRNPTTGAKICPQVFVPNAYDPVTGLRGRTMPICLDRFDLWDKASGIVLAPDWTTPCAYDTSVDSIAFEIDSGDLEWNAPGLVGGSYLHAFSKPGRHPYQCMRHLAEKGTVVVAEGGPDSATVQILDGSGFSPSVVTVRPGGSVRWVNQASKNHALQTDRHCQTVTGVILHRVAKTNAVNLDTRVRYPIGRYTYVDHEVHNGFMYFYSVTAFDSTTVSGVTTQLGGLRSAFEAEGVEPQARVDANGRRGVWVVPNPYRGYAFPGDRPSSWDLTPSPTDPTGTHIDFMGLPAGAWTIRIYTLAGDLVQTLHWTDAVNASIRHPVSTPSGRYPGTNRQQDNPSDGEARWNLVSRNGQDVASGIYLFTVESSEGTQRGKFVIIR